jgi:alpha-ribazole phosphatase
MVRLLLVRHAATTWNAQQRFQGHTDVPLSQCGQQQVVALVQALRAETIHACYTSDLRRAWETAHALAHPRGLPLRQEPRLREMAFGVWEGLTYADLQQRDPSLLATWQQNPMQVAPPGGETLHQVADRVQAMLADIITAHQGHIVLLVSHGGPLRVLLCLALGLSPRAYWQFSLAPASWAELEVHAEGAILGRLNATGALTQHCSPDAARGC